MNRYESKGKTFEANDTELDHHHPCLGRNLWTMQQYKSFGSSSASKVQRNPLFSSLEPKDVSYFKEILGEKHVVEDEERLETANTDWMHKYRGSSKLMLLPKNTEEVLFFYFPLTFFSLTLFWIVMSICVKKNI